MKTFLGKRECCGTTKMSSAFDHSVCDGSTILLEVSEEHDKHKYVFIGGDTICSFLTGDSIFKCISNMEKILTPYSIAIGEDNIYFLTPFFKFFL